jgi:hypothetical protein
LEAGAWSVGTRMRVGIAKMQSSRSGSQLVASTAYEIAALVTVLEQKGILTPRSPRGLAVQGTHDAPAGVLPLNTERDRPARV